MALEIIGAGWGRTGTESLKKALEILGYNKCYHMFELIKEGDRLKYWEQLEKERTTDFESLFQGYKAAVDFPVAAYYKEIMQHYPHAKIILTVRDPDKWFDSATKTIFRGTPAPVMMIMRFLGLFSKKLGYFPKVIDYAVRAFLKGMMQGKVKDRDFMKAKLKAWNEEVMQYVPADKLLVYEVKDGWEPLCAFLDKPEPQVPFPRSNDSDAFQKRLKLKNLVKG
jgi:hypothetical protein